MVVIAFCVGWVSAVIFLWVLLNKFDANGTFSSLFFDSKSLRFSPTEDTLNESISELEEVIRKSHQLFKDIQDTKVRGAPRIYENTPKLYIDKQFPTQLSRNSNITDDDEGEELEEDFVPTLPKSESSDLKFKFQVLKEGTLLIRRNNKWHKFHGVLSPISINLMLGKQSNSCAGKILFNSNLEVQKKPAIGCFSLSYKNNDSIIHSSNDNNFDMSMNEFLSHYSQVSSCILRFRTDEEAEEWVQTITELLSAIQAEDDSTSNDIYSSIDFDEAEEQPDQDFTEEVKQPGKEKEDVYAAAKSQMEKKALTHFIRELKGMYDPGLMDGYMLMRFLRARQYNVPKAVVMLTNYMNWRKEFKPHQVTRDMVLPEIKKKKGYFHYFDKKKHPNLIVMVGKHSQKDSDLPTMLNLLVYILESAVQYMPDNIERFSAIIDCTNLSINQVDFPLVKDGLNILQNYYPERLGGVYIVNYPMLFSVVWKLIKPLLDARTSEKIKFCTTKELLEFYDTRYLPVRLGGTSRFEDTDYELGLETLQEAQLN